MKARTHTRAPRSAGRTGVGLALAATTVAAMTIPAAAAGAVPASGVATVGATALAPSPAPAARPTAAPMSTYRVQAGDTVSAIAARSGTTVQAIVSANNLNSRALIKVGQTLRIPGTVAVASTTSSSSSRSATTHTVRSGDTVSALAKRYGTSVQAIVSANNLNSRALIIIGQQLTIPGSSSSGSSAAAGSSSSAATSSSSSSSSRSSSTSSGGSYTVRSGDTVSAIAQRHGTTVSAIAAANNLRNASLIYVGQRLTLPGGSGSSSSSGSTEQATRPATIPTSNSSSGSSSNSSSGSSSSSSSGSSSSSSSTHTVRSGETLSALASRYKTTVRAIVDANDLASASLIYVGQKLTIPGATSSSSSSSNLQLVGNTFLGRTYPDHVVASANQNKATLLSMDVPSRDQMRAMVRETAVEMGVDPALALAIAHQESGFDARAVSPANAIGTMQVIPSSGEWASDLVGRRLNLLDPQDNVTAGVAILRQLVRTAPNFDTAVAGYYQGLAGVMRNGMYADTRNYVSGIKNLMRQY